MSNQSPEQKPEETFKGNPVSHRTPSQMSPPISTEPVRVPATKNDNG